MAEVRAVFVKGQLFVTIFIETKVLFSMALAFLLSTESKSDMTGQMTEVEGMARVIR